MKNIVFSLVAVATFGLIAACGSTHTLSLEDIPVSVSKAFRSAHPDLVGKWNKEADGSYEVDYKLSGEAVSENWTVAGELLETEMEIPKSKLPAAVQSAIKKEYKDCKIKKAAQITYPDGKTVYEAELQSTSSDRFDVYFSPSGKLVNVVKLTK